MEKFSRAGFSAARWQRIRERLKKEFASQSSTHGEGQLGPSGWRWSPQTRSQFAGHFPRLRPAGKHSPVKAALQRIRRLTAGVNESIDFPVNPSFSNGTTLADAVLRGRTRKEDTQMSVHTKAASILRIRRFAAERKVSEAKRFAQYLLLDEIPGLIFGLMTIAYIVTSLWSLT